MMPVLALGTTAAWFLVAYFAFDLWPAARMLSTLRLGDALDRRILSLLDRNTRSKVFAGNLRQMLGASSFRPGGEPLSVALFLVVSGLLALAFLVAAILLLHNPLAGALLGVLGAVLPHQLLQIDYARSRRKLRRQAVPFLLTLQNLYGICGDPVVAMERAVPRLKDPLRREVRWFVTAYRGGMPLKNCVETVKERLPNAILRQFWDDVRFFIERGGDFNESIAEHVDQLYQREIRAAERQADNGSTVTVFFALIGVYFVILANLARSQPEIMNFMVSTTQGKIAVALMVAIFMAAGYFVKLMTTHGRDD